MAPLAGSEVAPISTGTETAERVSGLLQNCLTRRGPPSLFQLVRTETTGESQF